MNERARNVSQNCVRIVERGTPISISVGNPHLRPKKQPSATKQTGPKKATETATQVIKEVFKRKRDRNRYNAVKANPGR